jgi:hypothetical protein
MPITAKFSNAHVDTYKGKRPVKAAWMAILPTGRIVSGHSLDRAKAEKTARGAASEKAGVWLWWKTRRHSISAAQLAHAGAEARKHGFASLAAYEAALIKQRADFVAACRFEIVDL